MAQDCRDGGVETRSARRGARRRQWRRWQGARRRGGGGGEGGEGAGRDGMEWDAMGRGRRCRWRRLWRRRQQAVGGKRQPASVWHARTGAAGRRLQPGGVRRAAGGRVPRASALGPRRRRAGSVSFSCKSQLVPAPVPASAPLGSLARVLRFALQRQLARQPPCTHCPRRHHVNRPLPPRQGNFTFFFPRGAHSKFNCSLSPVKQPSSEHQSGLSSARPKYICPPSQAGAASLAGTDCCCQHLLHHQLRLQPPACTVAVCRWPLRVHACARHRAQRHQLPRLGAALDRTSELTSEI